jgi:hypothetical protein
MEKVAATIASRGQDWGSIGLFNLDSTRFVSLFQGILSAIGQKHQKYEENDVFFAVMMRDF